MTSNDDGNQSQVPNPHLSMTKDAVQMGGTMSSVGFGFARKQQNFGFTMAKSFFRTATEFLHENGHVEEGSGSSRFLRAARRVLSMLLCRGLMMFLTIKKLTIMDCK